MSAPSYNQQLRAELEAKLTEAALDVAQAKKALEQANQRLTRITNELAVTLPPRPDAARSRSL
ncbi:hypothetical protein SEA_RONAN_35 [Mycobacterium phage Ronan]|uniref:Uncharacterized protein n=1 Tax=Mycobacterium phage LRRHood TaxID=663556 RepID=C9DBE7_9CAUD|nr:hypothetical protein LRRHOOD_37 [Mycobacterium phage LRRHood]ATN90000.1 hypothetical protein SEA_KOGUMA_36 [Mycobacterium phage Koguma]QAY05000.1 hypothetical protein SEA_SHAQNATO_36 [Mycobacterium phage Shaqnato]QDP44402.1 hypothetical protein SEA_GRUNGLE_33 [Mycobacterium phage Grungle]QKO02127.1 hypothetical protein SEA_RONAN_35 [Mycobacterium phage Ronan]